MALKFPIKSQTAFDVNLLLVENQSETGPGSFPGEVSASPLEFDVAARDLENQDVVANITISVADFTTGDETYLIELQGSDDNFTTIKQTASINFENANTDIAVDKLHSILMRLQSTKVRILTTTAGTTPVITVKSVWMSSVQT